MVYKIPNEVEYNPKEYSFWQKIVWTWKLWFGYKFKVKVKVKIDDTSNS